MMETLKVHGQLLPVSHRPPQLVLVIYPNSKRIRKIQMMPVSLEASTATEHHQA